MFPKPGANTTPVPKVSFVTMAGDLGFGGGGLIILTTHSDN